MSNKPLSTVMTDLIASYGNTSRNVINAYRTGGERVIDFVEQRWDNALEQSSDKLSAEVRDNAAAAQKLFGSFNAQGLALATNSADTLVNQLVKFVSQGVQRGAANLDRFEEKTGAKVLSRVAQATVPAAEAMAKLAARIEEQSVALVQKIAGEEAPRAAKPTAFKKARSAKAAA
ncbi:MAG: hypothetical protein JSR49_05300 [Proteobacteria bacterium]|nr:hypothetical protein [Pseudomonadota bacterium]